MTIGVPRGFRMGGAHCGIKRDEAKLDLALVVADGPAVAAGAYTQNLVCAAPVLLDRSRTPSDRIRAVVGNSGNANACTGQRGLEDARETARCVAEACGFDEEQVLVISTGVIGEFLPMEKIGRGIAALARELGNDAAALERANRGIMTTDTVCKLAGRTVSVEGGTVQIAGLAKGAAMIGPNMATMLAVVLTDARLTPGLAQKMLKDAVDTSFNCISVEGHTSTNDTVLLLASGAAGGALLEGKSLARFESALGEVCRDLARAIPADGEGVTHVIALEVSGCRSRQDAMQIAKTIANSALVKAAIYGADPNWGRIVSAAGYAGVPFDPAGVDLHLNGFHVYEQGAPTGFDRNAVSISIRDQRDTLVQLKLREGNESIRFWTTDLSEEYVRLNADYT